jgi:hypothetical protein
LAFQSVIGVNVFSGDKDTEERGRQKRRQATGKKVRNKANGKYYSHHPYFFIFLTAAAAFLAFRLRKQEISNIHRSSSRP